MNYVQAVPLFMNDDEGPTAYFHKYKAEIDAITGNALVLFVPRSVQEGDARDIVSAVDSKRYPGLQRSNLPCLWVEAGDRAHVVLKIPDTPDDIKRLMRCLADAVRSSTNLAEVKEKVMADMTRKSAQPPATQSVPPWFAMAGAVFGGFTLVFLMGLVVASMVGYDPSQNTRPLIIIVLSFAVALSFAFIGGTAAAQGNIPLPFAKEKPVAFSVSGGIAAFIITMLLGFWLYAK